MYMYIYGTYIHNIAQLTAELGVKYKMYKNKTYISLFGTEHVFILDQKISDFSS